MTEILRTFTLTFMQPNGEYTALMSLKELNCTCDLEEEDFNFIQECSCNKFFITYIPGFNKKIEKLLEMWAIEKIYNNREQFKLAIGQEPYINLDTKEDKNYITFHAPVTHEYRDIIRVKE